MVVHPFIIRADTNHGMGAGGHIKGHRMVGVSGQPFVDFGMTVSKAHIAGGAVVERREIASVFGTAGQTRVKGENRPSRVEHGIGGFTDKTESAGRTGIVQLV